MELTIVITEDSQPSKLLLLAEAIRIIAGERAACAKTCGSTLQVTGDAKELPQAVAEVLAPQSVSATLARQAVAGYAADVGPGKTVVAPVVDPSSGANAGPAKCLNCGFYDCRCEEFDADLDQYQRQSVDTAAVFSGSAVDTGKHPAEGLDTGAIFGGASSAAPAPSTAGVLPSTTAPTGANSATCPPVPGAPTSAATGGSPVPPAPTAAAPTSLAGGEVDKNGLPWDARIHARTKAKIADGTWRMKRGVEPETVNAVVAELKAAMGAPAVATPAPAAPAPTAPPVPGAPAVPQLGPFPSLMRALTPFICTDDNPNNRISQSGLRQFAARLGLINQSTNEGEIGMLMHRTDLITAFRELVNQHLAQWGEQLGA